MLNLYSICHLWSRSDAAIAWPSPLLVDVDGSRMCYSFPSNLRIDVAGGKNLGVPNSFYSI